MGLFGNRPNRQLLALDKRFTDAAQLEERDPAAARAAYQDILPALHAMSGLSSSDDSWRQKLITAIKRRLGS